MSRSQGNTVFSLFACCLLVKGARRSVICDLQRNCFRFIPNGLYEILTEHKGKTLDEIKRFYDNECDDVIDEYFEVLTAEELGFWCQDPEQFPPLDLAWEAPERISNAIVDVDSTSAHDFAKIVRELDDLGCKALEVRLFCSARVDLLWRILELTRFGRLRSIDFLVGYSTDLGEEVLAQIGAAFPRVSSFVIHSAPEFGNVSGERFGFPVYYRTDIIDSPRCCGQIHPGYFVTNIETFSEALSYNTCLNRKIAVDARGNIKNCPSMERVFGNIRDTSLHGVLAQSHFKDLWSINKDQIEICKDCEFRYICTDCRAYILDPENLYSKPSRCQYDPYTAEWKGR